MTSSRRDPLIEVAEATRSLLTRAAQAEPRLRPLEWRVLSAVIVATSTWTRLADRVYLAELAETCGIERPRNVGRELASLRDRGLIAYTPGRGRRDGGAGQAGMISIAPEDLPKGCGTATLTPNPRGCGAATLSDRERGAGHGAKGVRGAADKGRGAAPPPEEVPEEVPENDVVSRQDSSIERHAGPHPFGDADEVARRIEAERGFVVDAAIRRQIAPLLTGNWTVETLARHLLDATRDARGPGLLVSVIRDCPTSPPPSARAPGGVPAFGRTRRLDNMLRTDRHDTGPFDNVGTIPWCPECRDHHRGACAPSCTACGGRGVTTRPGAPGPGGRPGGPETVPCPECVPRASAHPDDGPQQDRGAA